MNRHKYECSICPECSASLLDKGAVWIVYNESEEGTENRSRSQLLENGLLDDPHGIVEKGWHSDTECYNCGESLSGEEIDPFFPTERELKGWFLFDKVNQTPPESITPQMFMGWLADYADTTETSQDVDCLIDYLRSSYKEFAELYPSE